MNMPSRPPLPPRRLAILGSAASVGALCALWAVLVAGGPLGAGTPTAGEPDAAGSPTAVAPAAGPAAAGGAPAGAAPAGPAGGGLEVRFYPGHALRTYPLDERRGWSNAVLQNAAVINLSARPVTLDLLELEVVAGGQAVQTHRWLAADLQRFAEKGAGLQKAGLLELYAFQFRPDVLLGAGVTLAAGRRLEPRQALLMGQRVFAWNGLPETIRLRAAGRLEDGAAVRAEAALPIAAAGSSVEYDFPLHGSWYVGAGQSLHSHHRWVTPEEFALDIARLGDGGLSHRGDGAHRVDYYAYGQPVLAAADGVVAGLEQGIAESDDPLRRPGESPEAYMQRVMALQGRLLTLGALHAAGNYVVLQHSGGEHSFYAHLQPGSVPVGRGDRVKRGQVIGRLGFSGNTTEPHLHFQVTDGPDPLLSAGIPPRFRNLAIPLADGPRAVQTGDLVEAE